jgi:aminopeptidase
MRLRNIVGNQYLKNGKKSSQTIFQENYIRSTTISKPIMKDTRIEKLAQILIDYSLKIKPNDILMINASPLATPLIKETYKQALKRGAHPHIRLGLPELVEYFYKNASDSQLSYVSPLSEFETKTITAQLSIISQENTRNLTNVNPKKQAHCSAAHQHLKQLFLKRAAQKQLRWCITQYPTNAAAQDADMSLEEYEEFVFKAAHIQKKDPIKQWQTIHTKQEHLREILQTKKNIHIIGKDTDLHLSVDGRTWINCAGKENFPDGEIFTGPLETSLNGHIHYSFPVNYGGHEVDGITLFFKNGKVIKANASQGKKFLKTMITMDEGAKYVGEFAFGTNYGIKKYTKNTLFDEKIGGTIHLALGNGYPETGSKNTSSLHWDMMCDLRKQGEVYADNELIFKKGEFLI